MSAAGVQRFPLPPRCSFTKKKKKKRAASRRCRPSSPGPAAFSFPHRSSACCREQSSTRCVRYGGLTAALPSICRRTVCPTAVGGEHCSANACSVSVCGRSSSLSSARRTMATCPAGASLVSVNRKSSSLCRTSHRPGTLAGSTPGRACRTKRDRSTPEHTGTSEHMHTQLSMRRAFSFARPLASPLLGCGPVELLLLLLRLSVALTSDSL